MKVISFLGFNSNKPKGYDTLTYTNPRTEATYPNSAAQVTTIFALEAVAEFYRPDEFYVLLTKEAETFTPAQMPDGSPNSDQKTLYAILNEKLNGRAQPITDVPSAQDIWDLFQKLTEHIHPGDEVVFDITNGFRTLPVIAMTAAAFLRVARNVTVRGIVYGAVTFGNPIAPIYDLLPLVELMDWTTATDKFLKTGEARELAACLCATDTAALALSSEDQLAAAAKLNAVAVCLENVSGALALTRPRYVLPDAQRLVTALEDAETPVAQYAKPFGLLLEQTRQDFQGLALAAPDTELRDSLAVQWRLIEWYLDKKQYIQSVTLAREWVVSLTCWRLGVNWTNGPVRDHLDKGLGTHMARRRYAQRRARRQPDAPQEAWRVDDIESLPVSAMLADIWEKIGNCRNNIAHCGMRQENQETPRQLVQQIDDLRQPLQKLAAYYELTPASAPPIVPANGYASQINALPADRIKGCIQGFADKWSKMAVGPARQETARALLNALDRAKVGNEANWQSKEWVCAIHRELGC